MNFTKWDVVLYGFDGRLGAGSLMCGKKYDGFFKLALTFAAKTMQHTANQLHQWAREPDFGVKRFTTRSIFLTSRSVCLPYQGVVFFVLCPAAEIASVGHGASKYCISKINMKRKIR